jgi:hypothetical protein
MSAILQPDKELMMRCSADMTEDQWAELGDVFEEHRDAGQSVADAARALVTRMHEIRAAGRSSAPCTVPAVLAECDAETLSDIWQGGGQGR